MKYLLAILLLATTATAQNPRDFIDGEFIGLESLLPHIDDNGVLQVAQCTTRIGRLKRGTRAFPFTNIATADLNTIPDVCLMGEHWWLSFELLMMCQRDYGVAVARINDEHDARGWCRIDDTCSPLRSLVTTIRDYWPPFNVVNSSGYVAHKDTYRDHLAAGIDGLNLCLYHRGLAEQYLSTLR